jgi:hypothetical protein
MQCACALFSSVACPALQYFSTLSLKCTIFRKKLLNIKIVFWFSLHVLSEKSPILRRMQREFFSTDFQKLLKFRILWKSVQWEPAFPMWTDRQTRMTRLVDAFRKFATAPWNRPCLDLVLQISNIVRHVALFHADINDLLQPNIISSLLDHPLCEVIPVFQPSRFYPCPSRRDNFKALRGLAVWKLCLAWCLQNLCFISMKKLATFDCVVGIFLPLKLNIIFENYQFTANESKTFSLTDQSLEGNCWRCRPGEWGVEVQKGRVGRNVVVFSVWRGKQGQIEGCDC